MTTRTAMVVATVVALVGLVASAASGAPATVPGAPTITGFTPGTHRAAIAFDAPASDGGSAISQYVARCSGRRVGFSRKSPVVVQGLQRAGSFTCRVSAKNRVGFGPPSAPFTLSIGGTACSAGSGTIAYTPPLPKLGDKTVVTTVLAIRGTLSSCDGASGVTSATFAGASSPLTALNCNNFVMFDSKPVLVPLVVTWNTQATSSIALQIRKVKGEPTVASFTGTVTAGLFKDLHPSVAVAYTVPVGGCVVSDLATLAFKQIFALRIA